MTHMMHLSIIITTSYFLLCYCDSTSSSALCLNQVAVCLLLCYCGYWSNVPITHVLRHWCLVLVVVGGVTSSLTQPCSYLYPFLFDPNTTNSKCCQARVLGPEPNMYNVTNFNLFFLKSSLSKVGIWTNQNNISVYNCVQVCITVYNCVQLCTSVYNSVQQCTTVYNSVQLCTTVYNSVQ